VGDGGDDGGEGGTEVKIKGEERGFCGRVEKWTSKEKGGRGVTGGAERKGSARYGWGSSRKERVDESGRVYERGTRQQERRGGDSRARVEWVEQLV